MKPVLLDLFCGAGGCAMGYSRAGFRVVGVDNRPMKRYPFEFVQADALEFCRDHGGDFDVIHASPPCQGYSVLAARNKHITYPNLLPGVRDLLLQMGKPFIIENVPGAPVERAVLLCGSMFGRSSSTELHGHVILRRHRLFESSEWLYSPSHCTCHGKLAVPVFGHGAGGNRSKMRGKGVAQASRDVMGIGWMNRKELDQSIPPCYTHFLGTQLRRIIGH